MKLTSKLKRQLCQLLGASCVQTDETSLALYGYDCSVSRARPDGVVHLQNTQQIAPLLKWLYAHKIPFVAHASATNHAGSCVPLQGGLILNLGALNHILEINTREGYALVEPGVVVGDLQARLAPLGFFYAPDPASESVCTVGGNLAQNASGARCMKYGATLDHVIAVHFVLPDGSPVSWTHGQPGPDMIGLLAGSEGTLGIITQLKVKILPLATHLETFLVAFPSLQQSIQAVSDLTAQGVIPRCVEAMDQLTLQSVEEFSHAGYPVDVGALLLVELDGSASTIKKEKKVLEQICHQNQAQYFIPAVSQAQRAKLWSGRKSAFAAMARLAPNVMVGDGTVPRSALPDTLQQVQKILQESHLRAGLLFHAGDGNFHPHILFDQRNSLETQHAHRVMNEILKLCVQAGGTLSGEHGIGVEKRAVMAKQYDVSTLRAMSRLKQLLDPLSLANPLKIIPHNYAEKAAAGPVLSNEIKTLQTQLLQMYPCPIVGLNSQLKTKEKKILSSHSLDQIIEIDTANYTATVQAGVSLTVLAQALKKAGAYSVLPAAKGSVGGAFCSGCFPDFYAHVTGIEALLPNGSFIRYGGKFTKNSAGYHLTRLLAGSQGTLGLVTQLTFRIFAHPVDVLKPQPFTQVAPSSLWKQLVEEWRTEVAHG
ncbi:MAG: FAD-binding protein [Elusimicrobiaceae bacterium]|nr:FAD-binding protein [Elusimicrobiaceae bacterium]